MLIACEPSGRRSTSLSGRKTTTTDTSWAVSASPVIVIGGEVDSRTQFHRISAGCGLSDRRLAVADGGTKEIRIFSSEGRYLTGAGREGNGPGEFASIDRLFCLADTLVSFDVVNLRISLFDVNGRFLGSKSLPATIHGADFLPLLEGVFADGSLLISTRSEGPGTRGTPGVIVRSIRLHHFVWSGTTRPLGDVSYREFVDRAGVTPLPFTPPPSFAVSGAEVLVLQPQNSHLYRLNAVSGMRDSLSVSTGQNAPVTDSLIEAYRAWRLAGVRDAYFRQRVRQILDQIPYPVRVPIFSRVVVDADSMIWLEHYRPFREGAVAWTIVDQAGRRVAEITLPDEIRVLEVGRDYVLGVGHSQFDAPDVRLYELHRPTPYQ